VDKYVNFKLMWKHCLQAFDAQPKKTFPSVTPGKCRDGSLNIAPVDTFPHTFNSPTADRCLCKKCLRRNVIR